MCALGYHAEPHWSAIAVALPPTMHSAATPRRMPRLLGVRPQDVFVSLVEVRKANWSFGLGVARYAN